MDYLFCVVVNGQSGLRPDYELDCGFELDWNWIKILQSGLRFYNPDYGADWIMNWIMSCNVLNYVVLCSIRIEAGL